MRYIIGLWNKARGYQRLTWSELDAWIRVCDLDLHGYEVEVIRELDSIFWNMSDGS